MSSDKKVIRIIDYLADQAKKFVENADADDLPDLVEIQHEFEARIKELEDQHNNDDHKD